ncbi:TPR and ankyrin repeat-containing protein 1-like [Ruditapes philippinarum]|uniref:TPR and ankyrin repeat-containing protein 1-like n=1 Tax=Ruditapes philippinarum TaxID=129788 RepID=UPI00295BC0BC|nr:TPR and ankyrin repeat-containing protein 1-like [Ruditapes philippinarum]
MAGMLLMKEYNDVLRKDKKGKIPYDYLHDDYPCRIYDLFLPDNKTIEHVHVRRLCDIGKKKNENNEHENAIYIFSKILLTIKRDHFMGHEDIHAFTLKNRADSYLKIGDSNKALNDANRSLKIVPSYDVFLIRAKASTNLERYDHAFDDFINAFHYAGACTTSQVLDVCEEIVKFLFQLPNKQSTYMIQRISTTLPGNGPLWARICHKFVLQNEWKTGKIAHSLIKYDQNILPKIQINVACFCSLNDIRSHPWSADMMLYFLHCESDRKAISLEPGDTYLHASVRISLVASFPDLLAYVIKNTNANELHVCDQAGNTLLHIATKERKVDRRARFGVIKILLEYGIDAQKLNNDKRTAYSYLSGEKKNRELIVESIQKQTTGNQKKMFNGNESRSHPNRKNAMQQGKKERRRKCDQCEQQHSKALEIISTDKTGGLKAMTDILTSDHLNTFHTSIEKKVVDDLVKYLESPEDITTFLSPLRKAKFYMIMEGLFLVQKWAPLILTVKAFNKKFVDNDLKKFTSKFTVEPLIVATESVSDDEEFENICFLLNNGWSIGDGNGKVTLKKAVDLKKFKLSVELIKRGADVSDFTLQEGDTPIHALIKVALEVTESKFIEDLLNKWNTDKDKYSCLDPEQVDVNGDCIYHLLTKSGYSDMVLQITEILCDYNVSAYFYNKEQKYPSEYVKKKHFRLLDYLKNASRIKASRKQVAYETFEKEDKNDSTTGAHEFDLEHKPKPKSRKEQIQESRKNIEYLLSLLPEYIEVNDVV